MIRHTAEIAAFKAEADAFGEDAASNLRDYIRHVASGSDEPRTCAAAERSNTSILGPSSPALSESMASASANNCSSSSAAIAPRARNAPAKSPVKIAKALIWLTGAGQSFSDIVFSIVSRIPMVKPRILRVERPAPGPEDAAAPAGIPCEPGIVSSWWRRVFREQWPDGRPVEIGGMRVGTRFDDGSIRFGDGIRATPLSPRLADIPGVTLIPCREPAVGAEIVLKNPIPASVEQ